MPPSSPSPSTGPTADDPGVLAALVGRALVLVAGKGGVGRSTVATAIAMQLATSGRSVALVHAAEAPPVLPPPGGGQRPHVIALDRDDALDAYVGEQLPGPLAGALRLSRAFRLVTAATPGLGELLAIGELRRLAGRFDQIVFDAPATGHLLAMFDAPGRFERAAAVGPIARRANDLGAWIVDPAVTATVAVTTGDGLAVSELLDLAATLETRTRRRPDLIVANRLAPPSPAPAELEGVAGRHDGADDAPLLAALDHLAARGRSERAQLGRLTKAFGDPPVRAFEQPGAALAAVAAAIGTPAPATTAGARA